MKRALVTTICCPLLASGLLVAACSSKSPATNAGEELTDQTPAGQMSTPRGATAAPSSPAPALQSKGGVSMHVNWITRDDFKGMLGESELVVQGRVLRQRSANRRSYPFDPKRGRYLTPEEAGDVFAELPLTVSTIAIDQMVYEPEANSERLPKEIDIQELGGLDKYGRLVEPEDHPILRVGEQGVFFLYKGLRSTDADRYFVAGGYQGRFAVQDAQIHTLAPEASFRTYEGASVESFRAEVQRLIPIALKERAAQPRGAVLPAPPPAE